MIFTDDSVIIPKNVIESIEILIVEGLQTDGGHHKQWYLEKIAQELEIDLNDIEHEKGIAP